LGAEATAGAEASSQSATTAEPDSALCWEQGVRYDPIDMFGSVMTQEDGIRECQERCMRTMGCAHFSYFAVGGVCHLQDKQALPHWSPQTTAGPPSCEPSLRKACYEVSTVYFPTMPGLGVDFAERTDMSAVEVAKACKKLCAQQEACAHYVVQFPERTCELAPASALRVSRMRAVSGPPACDRAAQVQGKFLLGARGLGSRTRFAVGAAAVAALASLLLACAVVRETSRSGTCRRLSVSRKARPGAMLPSERSCRYSPLVAGDSVPASADWDGHMGDIFTLLSPMDQAAE